MATTSAQTTDQASTIGEGTRLEGIRHKVFLDRYALKGEDGTPLEEYPEQMWRRVAAGIAAVEPTAEKRSEWTEKFYDLLRDFKFVPGGRILSGAGAGHQVTFYNCFVVGLGEDPLDPTAPRKPMLDPAAARPAFFNALAQMTDIMSRSGGVGMNLSALPPKGTPITADGRGRHGPVRPTVALSLSHPDVGRLLDEKDGPNLAHVDVAVIVPPEFDQALADDAEWTPRWGDMRGETVRARELWERVTADHGRRAILLRPDTAMLAIDDSRDAIVGGAAEAAMALFHGEAPVVDFSRLRPKGAYIKTVNGTSSGPVAWMYLYDAVARADDGAAPTEKGVVWFGEIASVITGKTIQQGGCFGPDQRIATNRGLLRAAKLADLIDAGEKVDALTHEGPRSITWAFRNGTKPLCRVTTARGFTVDVTPEHKMGVLRNGKLATVSLEELEVGDEVLLFLGQEVAGGYVPLESAPYRRSIMSTRLNEDVRLPDMLDEKLAYFLGYLHGDGYVHWGRKVTWRAPKAIKLATADAYPAIRHQLVEYARDLFGVEPVVEDCPGAWKNVALSSRVLIDWLQHNGLLKAHSEAVRVPEKIFRSPSSVMAAFVAGYFDADGSDRGRKSGYGFDSVSLDLLRDIQQLLATNGILSHIHTADRSALGWRTIHRLVVTGAEFKARMNLFMHMALKNRAREGFRNHRNGYPGDVWPELGVPGRYYQGLWDSTKPDISYRALSRVQDRLVVKGEVALAERIKQLLHTVPDHIVSIEPLGESEVYDFEVADVHMLSGNGFYTSNSRRGALMLMLDDDHPDIEEFIAAKRIGPDGRPVMIEHANMSLCISDAFMAAVRADLPWDLKWQGQTVRTVRARDIWNQICTAAWNTAEPGVVFMERCRNRANTWYYERINCVNPCGEQPLPPGGVCNLGALNLACYVDDNGQLLEDDLARDAAYATRFLDDVIDATPYFSELHVKMQREGTRRTGLGTMGLADALIKMGVAYGGEQSLEVIDRIYSIIRDAAYRESVELAKEKGPFPRFDREQYLQGWFIKRLPQDIQDGIREHGIRNGVALTQAPTGTTSLLAGVSSGIEPVYDFAMKRVDRTGEHILYHPLYQAWREAHPNEEKPPYFVGAKDLTPDEHVVVQARVQQYTDSSISKCVSGDTLVTSERGLLPIADLYAGEAPDTFRSLPLRVASLGEAGTQAASHFYYGGKQPTLTVRLADGHTITGTPNHRLYTGTPRGLEWKRLDELGAGDYVALKIGSQVFGADVSLRGFEQSTTRAGYQKTIRVPASMNPALAHFVGAWCAEGSIDHYTVRITNNERPVLERLNEEARLLFGIEGTIAPQGRGKALTLSIASKSLCELLRFVGCRRGAAHKVVPWSILQSSRESVVAFLSGLYLDGFVTPAKIGICLASRTMIEQLQLILDNLGVQSWITAKRNTVYERDYYELNAHGQEGQKLARLLLFDEAHKNARAQTLLQRSFGPSKSDVIPLEARESVFASATRTVRYRHHAYSQALSGLAEGRMLSWGGLRHLANDPDVPLTPDLRAVFGDNLHFCRVVAVEDAGVRDVYDLTVPSTQAFVANGIVNHNTANAPHDHTIEDVKQLYTLAYDLGCKGVTYYRDGSRDAVLTSVTQASQTSTSAGDGTAAPAAAPAAPTVTAAQAPAPTTAAQPPAPAVVEPSVPAWIVDGHLKRRPGEMAGFTRNVAAPEGKVNITINSDEDGPLEVFINVGRAGSDVAALAEALGRLISLQLRLPSTMSQEERLRQVANQLRGIGGSRSIGFGRDRVLSLPDAVAQAIYRHLEEHPTPPRHASAVPAAQLALPVSDPPAAPSAPAGAADGYARAGSTPAPTAVLTGNLCPQCGSSGSYVYEEGCRTCHNCGYSEC